MPRRGSYEFSELTKDEVYRKQRHKFPEDAIIEVDHIISVRQCIELGIPDWLCASQINAQLLTRRDNREKSDKDADPEFVDYVLSLVVRML